jgi:hypothetical protein
MDNVPEMLLNPLGVGHAQDSRGQPDTYLKQVWEKSRAGQRAIVRLRAIWPIQ